MPDLSAPESNAVPQCPKCGGDMWDNRESKRNPRAPDFKCKDKSCDGVVWPPRQSAPVQADAEGPVVTQAPVGDEPACPVCGGRMWDDRASKRNPRAPDFKCRNKPKFQGGPGCPGVIWPPREGSSTRSVTSTSRSSTATAPRPAARNAPRPAEPPSAPPMEYREFSDEELPDDDDLPF